MSSDIIKAAENGDFATFKRYFDVLIKRIKTVFYKKAVKTGNLKTVKYLSKCCVDVNDKMNKEFYH